MAHDQNKNEVLLSPCPNILSKHLRPVIDGLAQWHTLGEE